MTIFDTPNYDSQTIGDEKGTRGKAVGFLEGLSASWDYQHRDASQNAIGFAFEDQVADQNRKLVQRGMKPINLIDKPEDTAPYLGGAGVPGGIVDAATAGVNWALGNRQSNTSYRDVGNYFNDGGTPEIAKRVADYDAQIDKLNAEHPDLGLMTAGEQWGAVKQKAQDAAKLYDRTGWFAGAVGGAAASMDPRTDPLNFAALPLGGAGKTVLGRIGMQAGIQGGIQAVDEFTGVQANKEALGLPSGAGDALRAIGGAAVGGAGFQALGEGLGAIGRRWFRSVPHDPAPPPKDVVPAGDMGAPAQPIAVPDQRPAKPSFEAYVSDQERFLKDAGQADGLPYGDTRIGHKKSVLDYNAADSQLSDWSGPAGFEVKPHTDTAAPPDITTFDYGAPYTRSVESRNYTVDELARKMDPQTFDVFDKLQAEANQIREQLGAARGIATRTASDLVHNTGEIDAQIASIEARMADASPKQRNRLANELDALKASRPPEVPNLQNSAVDKGMQRLQQIDYTMRDMAPVVNRAYGIAKNAWQHDTMDPDARAFLKDLEQRGKVQFREPTKPFEPPVGPTLEDKAPILAANRDIVDALPAKSDLSDAVSAIFKHADKIKEEADAKFSTQIGKLIEPNEKVETGAELKARFADASGAIDNGKMADKLVEEVQTALKSGKKVTIFPEGKPVDIVSIDKGMMADAAGQRWGTLPLIMKADNSKPSIKIADSDGYIHLANGQKLPLDEQIHMAVGEAFDGSTEGKAFSIKELLQHLKDDSEVLNGVGVCSVHKAT